MLLALYLKIDLTYSANSRPHGSLLPCESNARSASGTAWTCIFDCGCDVCRVVRSSRVYDDRAQKARTPRERTSATQLRHRRPTDLSLFTNTAYATGSGIWLPGHALAYKWIRTCTSRRSRSEGRNASTLRYLLLQFSKHHQRPKQARINHIAQRNKDDSQNGTPQPCLRYSAFPKNFWRSSSCTR